jgi:Asp-tRNA(Asn)/Glu-tRNA(Gln) amidotransferase A subunit family amidase
MRRSLESGYEHSLTDMIQALHVPVISIPGFAGENGLPIGLSLVAPRYYDRHLLAVSAKVGDLFGTEGGWKASI